MKIYKNLYTSEILKNKEKKILSKIKKGKYPLDVFVLTLNMEEGQHLEIYPACMFYQTVIRHDELLLVGIAFGYEDALFLLKDIVEEVYRNTKDVDLRSYILEHNC